MRLRTVDLLTDETMDMEFVRIEPIRRVRPRFDDESQRRQDVKRAKPARRPNEVAEVA